MNYKFLSETWGNEYYMYPLVTREVNLELPPGQPGGGHGPQHQGPGQRLLGRIVGGRHQAGGGRQGRWGRGLL